VTLRLRITAKAAGEIERADTWWRDNRLAVPGALREDLKATFKLLLQQPGVGVKVAGRAWPEHAASTSIAFVTSFTTASEARR
jgi:hypothetical protein